MEPVYFTHCRDGGVFTPMALSPFAMALQMGHPLANGKKVVESPSSERSPPIINHPVLSWTFDNIRDWLHELHLGEYADLFALHAVNSGKIMLQLSQEDLKEMGVNKVGDRLTLCNALDELRSAAGMIPKASYLYADDFVDR